MPSVQVISILVVASHVLDAGSTSLEGQTRGCRRSGRVVIEVEPDIAEALLLKVGQGAAPEVRGIEYQHRPFGRIRLLQGQVGQEIHEALEDLKEAGVSLVMEGHTFARTDKTLKERVTRLEALTGRVTQGEVGSGVPGRLKCDLREVFAGDLMIDPALGQILQQGRVLEWGLTHQLYRPLFFFFTSKARLRVTACAIRSATTEELGLCKGRGEEPGLLKMKKRVPHIALEALLDELDDVATTGKPVIEPKIEGGIHLEGRVFIAVAHRRTVPQLTSTLTRPSRLEAFTGEVFGYRDALGL